MESLGLFMSFESLPALLEATRLSRKVVAFSKKLIHYKNRIRADEIEHPSLGVSSK